MTSFKKRWDAKKKKETLSDLRAAIQKITRDELKIETHACYLDNGTGKLHIRLVLVEEKKDS